MLNFVRKTIIVPRLSLVPFSMTPSLGYCFSSGQKPLNTILESLKISINGEQKNMMESGLIQEYSFDIEKNKAIVVLNTTRNFPQMKNFIIKSLIQNGLKDVEVKLAQKEEKKIFERRDNLKGIKKVIAVSSCKGGVGKSTIAVNLAYGLKQQGNQVGIFDADIYGPSLPTMVNLEGHTLESDLENSSHIIPKDAGGVKCMSFGFVANQPATMRGPMASSIASQLLLQTKWGELDYLIVDMPPGTGDINLSICEELQIDGALIVTTPQRLSFMDVLKGIQMFQDLRVRILGIVENMSYYSCSDCGDTEEIFGKGHNKIIMDQLGIENAFKMPLIGEVNRCSDAGTPAVETLPNGHFVREMYSLICASLKKELEKPKSKTGVFYSTTERVIIVEEEERQKKIDPKVLRSLCKCPECVSDVTGEKLIKESEIDPEVYPIKIEKQGNYAVGVVWSDGHKNSIYSFRRLFSDEIGQK